MALTPYEMDKIVQDNDVECQKILARVFSEGRVEVDGDSYIPDDVVEKLNETYGTNYDNTDIDLNTDALSGRCLRVEQFIRPKSRGDAR